MKKSRDITEASARLEKAVAHIADDSYSPLLLYQCYEMTAISILDSEAHLYNEGELSAFLLGYLAAKQYQLGIQASELT
ncbi:hypothetical protein MAMP_01139 [Methylophaga aminisulfidivorans MP]|uniref:Uncharacterized protein n=1 Tax=Methylophaga aminisulfidivorans MP TaxID=1026882 RepID=F5SZQ3_9GAMM|nr:hypothetical protein [Methylophaga aminisulfidivorans]EGL54480.1 hypothetical protein MAMP_01139 [Methylophaga aminisulfidivorans MP]